MLRREQTPKEKVRIQMELLMKNKEAFVVCDDEQTVLLFEKALEVMGFDYKREIILIHNEVYQYTI